MIILETDFITVTKHKENIVIIDAKKGTSITKEKSEVVNASIEEAMGNSYGIIINRREDYSISPVEVYKVLNNLKHLKAIAIVAYRNITLSTIETEQLLSDNPLESFFSIEAATKWMGKILDKS